MSRKKHAFWDVVKWPFIIVGGILLIIIGLSLWVNTEEKDAEPNIKSKADKKLPIYILQKQKKRLEKFLKKLTKRKKDLSKVLNSNILLLE